MKVARIVESSFFVLACVILVLPPTSGCGDTGPDSAGVPSHETASQAVFGGQLDSDGLYPYVCTLVAHHPYRVGWPPPDGEVTLIPADTTLAAGGITFVSPTIGVTAAHLRANWFAPWDDLRVTCEPDVGGEALPNDFPGLSGTLYEGREGDLALMDLAVFELDEPLILQEYAHLPAAGLLDRIYGNGTCDISGARCDPNRSCGEGDWCRPGGGPHLTVVGYGMDQETELPGDLGYRRYAEVDAFRLIGNWAIGISPNIVRNGDSGGPLFLADSPKTLGWCCAFATPDAMFYWRIDRPRVLEFIDDPGTVGVETELLVTEEFPEGVYCPCEWGNWACCP